MYNQKDKPEKIGTFFRFEDLRIYNKSLDYITWLQDVTMLFPDNDRTQFVLRFNDSARNIAFFIAEGSARNKSQFIHSLKLAKSAIRECVVFTALSVKQVNITESQEEESRRQLMEMTKMIGALISSLQRSNATANNNTSSNSINSANRNNGNENESSYRNTRYSEVDGNGLNQEITSVNNNN
jgi:four helix bundle protein